MRQNSSRCFAVSLILLCGCRGLGDARPAYRDSTLSVKIRVDDLLSWMTLEEKVAQILQGWYLGQEGGTALAEVLFGDVNPSGKLSVTFPRSVGQIPAHYGQKPSARRGYLFADKTTLFPFGHGSSYAQIDYFGMFARDREIRAGESTQVVIRLQNSSPRAATEVVQMYIRDKVSTVTRPSEFEIFIGPSSTQLEAVTLTVTK
jgi:beta-glucosidase